MKITEIKCGPTPDGKRVAQAIIWSQVCRPQHQRCNLIQGLVPPAGLSGLLRR